jgi:hypothetical protein
MKTVQNKKSTRFSHHPVRKPLSHSMTVVRLPPRPAELSRSEVRRIVLDILG